jgi:catechol 2,3-dioxygenase-like lactoylglutathione lyase family enzyme
MIGGLAHVCFEVKDLEASLRFYRDQLGLPVAFEFRNAEGQRFGVYLKLGRRTFVELFQAKTPPPPKAPGSYRHFCVEVEDFPGTVAALRGRGVEVTGEKLGMDHSWQAWVRDPDGNGIELHGYTPESWQAPHLG